MKKIKILIKLGYKFSVKYFIQYFKLLIKPILAGVLAFIFFKLIFINPIFVVFVIPLMSYALWRGYFATYCLNYAAYDFIKNNGNISLENCFKQAKTVEKNFALYITFSAFLTLILYIPSILHFLNVILKTDILHQPFAFIAILVKCFLFLGINTLILFPFLNFITQAYFFKKEKENFFSLFLNCYKKLDITGVLILIGIFIISTVLNLNIILYLLFFLIVNPFIYAVNTFWYSTRVENINP